MFECSVVEPSTATASPAAEPTLAELINDDASNEAESAEKELKGAGVDDEWKDF